MTDTAEAARYRAARAAQNELQIRDTAANTGHETPEYLDTNDETAAAAAALPGWRIWIIDWQEAHRADFWPRLAAAEDAARALRRNARHAAGATTRWDRAAARLTHRTGDPR